MKFAEKCPKCGGFVQTKSVRKSIGLGVVEIPVAQFCLNPVCDWYQDFTEPRRPEEINEGYHLKAPLPEGKLPQFKMPVLSRNHLIALGIVVAVIILYFMVSFIVPIYNHVDEKIPQSPGSDISNNTTDITITAKPTTSERKQETPKSTVVLPIQDAIEVMAEPRSFSVKIDVGHGFFPDSITINISDSIVWINEENVRPRVVLISRDGLFEKHLMQYPEKYQFQFNKSGRYTFALAEYGTYKEYPNATGSVIVK